MQFSSVTNSFDMFLTESIQRYWEFEYDRDLISLVTEWRDWLFKDQKLSTKRANLKFSDLIRFFASCREYHCCKPDMDLLASVDIDDLIYFVCSERKQKKPEAFIARSITSIRNFLGFVERYHPEHFKHNPGDIWGFDAQVEKVFEEARSGRHHAQRQLYEMYKVGVGVRSSVEEGVHWLKRAGDNGDHAAKLEIGLKYCAGEEVAKSYAEAAQWFAAAAWEGSMEAAKYLGMMYENGYGVEQDDAAALKWYAQAEGSE